jgi:DNA-binding NarL/FixJ family response regulator
MYCGTCFQRETCTTLCDEAEDYVNEEYVPQREMVVDPHVLEQIVPNENWFDNIASNVYLTHMERQIVRLLGLGLTRADVCKVLEKKANTLDKAISRLKRKAQEMSGSSIR